MGSSGGGSSSGSISYPDYLEEKHFAWLVTMNSKLDTFLGANPYTVSSAFDPSTLLTASETAISTFDTAIDSYVPGTYFASLFSDVETEVDASMNDDSSLEGSVADTLAYPIAQLSSALVDTTLDSDMADMDDSFMDTSINDMDDSFIDSVINDTFITTSAAALQDELEDELNDYTLPEYKGSMRSLNATVTSAFPIGEVLLRARITTAVAKHSAELKNNLYPIQANLRANMLEQRIQLRAELIKGRVLLRSELAKVKAEVLGKLITHRNEVRGQLTLQRNLLIDSHMGKALIHTSEYLKCLQSLAVLNIEANRIAIVANKEENDMNIEIEAKEELWDFELLQYAGNMLAAVSGGTVSPKTPSTGQSALGGAMSGAAVGAQVGGGYGAIIGAIIGGIGGLLAGG